ncbi:MAG: hypothetical protein ACK55Z_17985 [bacterium]
MIHTRVARRIDQVRPVGHLVKTRRHHKAVVVAHVAQDERGARGRVRPRGVQSPSLHVGS